MTFSRYARLPAGCLAAAMVLSWASVAQGFACYNDAPTTGGHSGTTFLAWPISGQTFKSVVQPGDNQGCPFSDDTCTAKDQGEDGSNPTGQCDPVVIYATGRELDTDAITTQAILDEVKSIMDPILSVTKLVGSFIPEIGTAVKLGSVLLKAGIDVADFAAQTGIDFSENDVFLNGVAGGQYHYTDSSTHSTTTVAGC